MSDELVKRLRTDALGGYCNKRNIKQAADHIEQLEAQHANDCEMIARLREVLSGRTLDETHESFWKEKVRQLKAALAKADELAEWVEGIIEDGCPRCGGDCSAANPPTAYCPIKEATDDLAAYRQARDATR